VLVCNWDVERDAPLAGALVRLRAPRLSRAPAHCDTKWPRAAASAEQHALCWPLPWHGPLLWPGPNPSPNPNPNTASQGSVRCVTLEPLGATRTRLLNVGKAPTGVPVFLNALYARRFVDDMYKVGAAAASYA
jgi:hypothetical protein